MWCLVLSVWLVGAVPFTVWAADAPRMTKQELKGMLGKDNVIIIDVRSEIDWDKSSQKVPGSVREDLGKIESWMAKYPKDKILVLY